MLGCGKVRLAGGTDGVTSSLFIRHFLYAPVKKGQIVGEVRWIKDSGVIASSPVTAIKDVPLKQNQIKGKKQSLFDKIKDYLRRNSND